MSEAKSARINLRLNPESLETIRAAASAQQQDLTSFVLGAAMERARAVLAEDRLVRLTPHEVNQLERGPGLRAGGRSPAQGVYPEDQRRQRDRLKLASAALRRASARRAIEPHAIGTAARHGCSLLM